MAAFKFRKRRVRRWWYAGVTLVAAAVFTVFYVGGAAAVISGPPASPSSFEASDGNMVVNTSGNTDWNCFQGSGGFLSASYGSGFTASDCAVTTGATNTWADGGTTGVGTSEYELPGGTKFDDPCVTPQTGNNPNKDEWTNIAEYTESASNNDLFFYGASIRPVVNGNSSGNVYFSQAAPDPTTGQQCHTVGDVLLAFDFVNGGGTPSLHSLRWISSGTCYVGHDSAPCWGDEQDITDPTVFEGNVNTSTILAGDNSISGAQLPPNAFAEFGINLTKAVLGGNPTGALPCFATQTWISRSSGSSFTSQPEDVETVSRPTCGTITIVKDTLDGSGTRSGVGQDFGYTSSGGLTPAGFTLNDSNGASGDVTCTYDSSGTLQNAPCNTQADGNVPAGMYTVTEPSVAGFTLKSLVCTTAGGSGTTAGQDGSDPTTADITLGFGGNVVCTYTNQKNVATIKTRASSTGTVLPGTSVTDQATVSGNNTSLDPGGTVTFSLCGPLGTAAGCSSNDGSAGTGTLSGSGGVSTATSSPAVSPTTEGIYCFEAYWGGDTNYPAALDATSATNECFTVKKDNTQTVTTPSDSSGTSESSILLGGTIYDTAVVTGTAAGGDPSGTVAFSVCGPIASGTCDGSDAAHTAALLGSTGLTGNGDDTATAIGPTGGYTPSDPGRYCFSASYGGSTVYNGSSDSSSDECFTVTQIGTSTTTTPSSGGSALSGDVSFGDVTIYDHAVVQAATSGDGVPTGTVTFYLCDPSQTVGGVCPNPAPSGTQVGSAVTLGSALPSVSPPAAAADSAAFTNGGDGVNQTGTWCWLAVYSPSGTNGSHYTGSHDNSTNECFTVTDSTTASSEQVWYPNDSASVHASAGDTIYGTLTIQLYSDSNCGGSTLGSDSSTDLVSGQKYSTTVIEANRTATISVDSGTQTSFGVDNSNQGNYSWWVTFTTSDPNVAGSSRCETSNVGISN